MYVVKSISVSMGRLSCGFWRRQGEEGGRSFTGYFPDDERGKEGVGEEEEGEEPSCMFRVGG